METTILSCDRCGAEISRRTSDTIGGRRQTRADGYATISYRRANDEYGSCIDRTICEGCLGQVQMRDWLEACAYEDDVEQRRADLGDGEPLLMVRVDDRRREGLRSFRAMLYPDGVVERRGQPDDIDPALSQFVNSAIDAELARMVAQENEPEATPPVVPRL